MNEFEQAVKDLMEVYFGLSAKDADKYRHSFVVASAVLGLRAKMEEKEKTIAANNGQ